MGHKNPDMDSLGACLGIRRIAAMNNRECWIVIDNGAYGSTGNQETYANDINLLEIAKSVGFENAYEFEDIDLKEVINNKKCSFIRYSVEPGNSPAPVIPLSPEEIKERFMEAISK